jgi:HSP20 family protein
MNRLFNRFGFGAPPLSHIFTVPGFAVRAPAVELSEDGNAWRLTAELPGLPESDVEVVLADDVRTLPAG